MTAGGARAQTPCSQALNIKLHDMLVEADGGGENSQLALEITGVSNPTLLAAIIFGFNLLSLVLFLCMTSYQARRIAHR